MASARVIVSVLAVLVAMVAVPAAGVSVKLAAYNCNVSVPPRVPILTDDGTRLYGSFGNVSELDALTMKVLRVGRESLGNDLTMASPTTGYSMFTEGGILNPAGQVLFKVDFKTLTAFSVAKLGLPNNDSSIGTFSVANNKLYATISTCFLCATNVFAEVDTTTGALVKSVTVTESNGSGSTGLKKPAFDTQRNLAYIWVDEFNVTVVDLETFALHNITVPSNLSRVFSVAAQPPAVLYDSNHRYLLYASGRPASIVVLDMDKPEKALVEQKLSVPSWVNSSHMLLSIGVVAYQGETLATSSIFTMQYGWQFAVPYFMEPSTWEVTRGETFFGGLTPDEGEVVAGPNSFYLLQETSSPLPPPTNATIPKYCATSEFMVSRYAVFGRE